MRKNIVISIFFFCGIGLYAQVDTTKQVELNDIHIVEIDPTGNQPVKVERRDYTPLKSLVFNLGYGIPFISNDLLNSDIWNVKTGYAFQFGVDFKKQFTKEKIVNSRVVDAPVPLALGVGLGLSYYNKSADFESYSEQINNLTDVDGNRYNANLTYQNVKEQLSLLYLDIPLYLEIGKPSKTKVKAWGKIGLKGSVLLTNSFTGEGTYTSTGYYPDWNIILHNVPVLGFQTNAPCYENPEYNLNAFVLWSSVSAGITIPLSNPDKDILRDVILRLGIKWDYSLIPISKSTENTQFTGSTYWLDQSNILGDGSRMHYLGLEVGLIYSF